MRICDLNTGISHTTRALTDLRERWQEVRAVWQDEAARKFEDQYLRPLPAQIQQLLTGAQILSEILAKAERELDDRPESY